MGFLRRLFQGPHDVTSEVQGFHDKKPPEREMRMMVAFWLRSRWPNPEEVLHHRLQISWFRPLPNSRGNVKALRICLVNPQAIELRVQPPGYPFYWHCHLVCPSTDAAREILGRARPQATLYLTRHESKDKKQYNQLAKAPPAIAERRTSKRDAVMREQNRIMRIISRGSSMEELAHRLKTAHPEDGPLPVGLIHREVSALHRQRFDPETLKWIVWTLVEQGLLDPVSAEDDTAFTPTIMLTEYAQGYLKTLQEKEREAIEVQLESTRKLLEANRRERERAMARVEEFDAIGQRLSSKMNELKAALAEKTSQELQTA